MSSEQRSAMSTTVAMQDTEVIDVHSHTSYIIHTHVLQYIYIYITKTSTSTIYRSTFLT